MVLCNSETINKTTIGKPTENPVSNWTITGIDMDL